MCKKWTIKEFEDKKKALENRKRKKTELNVSLDTVLGTAATMGISVILYKIADLTY